MGEVEAAVAPRAACCSLYHQAIELVGKRWTGAILLVLMDGPLRFSEIKQLVPELSDRLLSERMKELEARGVVERRVCDGRPVRVEYALTEMGRELEPALSDRLLSERMKELEARGMVERRVGGASPARVEYELTPMGRDLAPAMAELEAWAHRWLD